MSKAPTKKVKIKSKKEVEELCSQAEGLYVAKYYEQTVEVEQREGWKGRIDHYIAGTNELIENEHFEEL